MLFRSESAPAYGRAFHEFCDHKVKSRTCAFFTRDNSAVVAAVLQRTLHVQELVRASGACAVCPHRVAMDAASRANLVVCDYNYLFSEILERFLPRLGRSLDDLVVIVDEAHNLPDRIRAHLGGDLSDTRTSLRWSPSPERTRSDAASRRRCRPSWSS